MAESPAVPILLLGDAEIGKSTFLSRLAAGLAPSKALPKLHDFDQPFCFDIRRQDGPFRLEFYDTSSPTNYTLLKPAIIILCYSIADRASLTSLHTYWKQVVETYYNYDGLIPVIILGLQRDVRSQEDYDGHVRSDDQDQALNPRNFTYPQEGLKVAQEMRCDQYCECSAVTGELCDLVFKDITKAAIRTTTRSCDDSFGTGCHIM